MKSEVIIEHIRMEVKSDFNLFTFNLEKALGITMPAKLNALGASPASMSSWLNNSEEEDNLVLLGILMQDDLSNGEHRIKIKQYQVGSPKTMLRMIAHNPGTGLYMPVHLIVYEKRDGKVIVEYDLPSSTFSQFNNAEILSDSIDLQNRLGELIRIADEKKPLGIIE